MPSRYRIMFGATLAMLALVCYAATRSDADGDRTAIHAVTVNASSEDTASIPDFDGDGTIGFGDFVIFAGVFGARQGDEKYDTTHDLNDDGEIGFSDFVIFTQNFGKDAPSPAVAIPDANLRTAIEAALSKDSGTPITQAEMATLDSLEAKREGISDLTGLDAGTNLTYLNLEYNGFQNLAPLAGLTNLQVLYISNNPLTDISPLENLTNMRQLSIGVSFGHGSITDISPLENLTNLENLVAIGHKNLSDISPLVGLTRLRKLSLASSPISDITPLAGLTNMEHLFLAEMDISDISPLAGMTRMRELEIMRNSITNISSVAEMTNLQWLIAFSNEITDVSPLAGLANLRGVYVQDNNIMDLAPLAANKGLDGGDILEVGRNPLNASSIDTHIPALLARGLEVSFDEIAIRAGADPQIYNDNVFVLPVTENLATDQLPLRDYAARFYEYFDDAFDFLLFVSNLSLGEDRHRYLGIHHHAKNDVKGLGLRIFSDDGWGSAGNLQSVLHFTFDFALSNGPALHEVMHRWANFIVPGGPHWRFSSANGQLGGFDIANLVDHGGGRYSAGNFTLAGFASNSQPFSPIELYLAGLIPPEEVPDLWVAEDGEALLESDGSSVYDDNGYRIFTASRVEIYAIEDIIAEHGPRLPDASHAQRDFRAAAILLVNEKDPVYSGVAEGVSVGVTWFSRADRDEYEQTYNFYEATGGRATITTDGLSQLRRSAGANKPAASSFGTPPPPIVDHWEIGNGREDLERTSRHIPAEVEQP